MALEKRQRAAALIRARRYESAIAVADGLGCYLGHEPVTAAPSTTDRLRNFARPNRAVIAGIVVAVLVAGPTASVWQAIRATHNKRQADLKTGIAKPATAKAMKQTVRACWCYCRGLMRILRYQTGACALP